jgi:hypothetical protein
MSARPLSPSGFRPIPRRGLSRLEAAIYVGVSTTKFDELVSDGRMPQPKRIDARKVWDIRALDQAFDILPGEGESESGSDWSDISTDAYGYENTTRSKPIPALAPRYLELAKEDNDSQRTLERMVEEGLARVWEPGEWEAEVRSRPLGKRERAALRAFYEAQNEPPQYIKGTGLDTTERLAARGFVAVVEKRGDRVPFYRITADGRAAWLKLQER